MVLATGWLAGQLRSPIGWYRRLTWVGLTTVCLAGLAVNVLMLRSDLLYPLLTAVADSQTHNSPLPLRKLDPTCRLRGWQTLGSELDRLRFLEATEGQEPVIVGAGWSLPGGLGFYF